MRTDDRGRWRLHTAEWLIWGGVTLVAFRMWYLHLREVEQRAEEAERTRDEMAHRRAMEERLRIARELHDSLTHSISVIQVQSGVAVHLAGKRGEEPPPALKAIQEAATDAARELRSTLGVLRAADDCDGSGLGHLDRLVARTRAAGQPVSVTLSGPVSDMVRELPPDVDQAAYRIVQEALTNVSRHAAGATASVHLAHADGLLTVRVDDDGGDGATAQAARRDGLASGPGLGLVGMRERVSALGGRFHAGPRAAGGFRVSAELPVRSPE